MCTTKRREKYKKTPLKFKVLFLKRVLEEGESIKKVSAEYKINYSTAKTLIRNEKLSKGKFCLSELGNELSSTDKENGAEDHLVVKKMCGFKDLELQFDEKAQPVYPFGPPKIEIFSKISFSSN